MRQKKENDDYRKELNRKHREWYARNKERTGLSKKTETKHMKEQNEQPEQEPQVED